ncbi:MAG: PepSY domain-containing protein [Hyphomicrobiaceae bacterium]|nr:PepSY domain-containing protein [Hyphomicrobiaceae bacterium]
MRMIRLVGVALAMTTSIGLALADGKKDCTTEPQAKWKPQAEAEATAKTAGYEVRRSKIEGSCYEVYAVKDGKNLELFYNPVDLKLMHTVTK